MANRDEPGRRWPSECRPPQRRRGHIIWFALVPCRSRFMSNRLLPYDFNPASRHRATGWPPHLPTTAQTASLGSLRSSMKVARHISKVGQTRIRLPTAPLEMWDIERRPSTSSPLRPVWTTRARKFPPPAESTPSQRRRGGRCDFALRGWSSALAGHRRRH